jgi:hypothetical protein
MMSVLHQQHGNSLRVESTLDCEFHQEKQFKQNKLIDCLIVFHLYIDLTIAGYKRMRAYKEGQISRSETHYCVNFQNPQNPILV